MAGNGGHLAELMRAEGELLSSHDTHEMIGGRLGISPDVVRIYCNHLVQRSRLGGCTHAQPGHGKSEQQPSWDSWFAQQHQHHGQQYPAQQQRYGYQQPYGQQAYPGPGSGYSSGTQPRRGRRKGHWLRNTLAGIGAMFVAGLAIGTVASHHSRTSAAPSASTLAASPAASRGAASPASSNGNSAAADACTSRPDASGDIYVRTIEPGEAPQAQELGGEWGWDYSTGKCLTSVQFMIAGAPQGAGTCTQVGYVADNPGYDANAASAPPLQELAAETGPAC
jgi:hypothetical protein